MNLHLISQLSIRIKILLGYALIILLVSVFIYTYFPNRQKHQAIAAIEYKIGSIIDMMSIGVGIGMGEFDLVAVGEVLDWAKKDNSLMYIVVIDQNNALVTTYNPKKLKLDIEKLKKNPNSFEKNRILHYKQSLIYQGQVFGTMLIGYSLHGLDREIAAQRQTTITICLAILITGILLSLIISARITSNITKLDNAVKQIAKGNTHIQVQVTSNDEIGKLASAFNDMTAKLDLSREELLSSTQYTHNIIMSMLDTLLVLDQENNIVSSNRAACTLLEYSEAEMYGKKFNFVFANPETGNEVLGLLSQTGQLQNQESTYLTKTGKPITVLFSAAIIQGRKGQQQGIVCVAQDISERKKSESQLKEYSAKLEKSNKELDKFNYVVSHDLKAPLRALYKLSEWIEEDMEACISEESRKNMDMLRGRISRMEGLINGLQEYSKTGRLIKLPETINTKEMVQEVIDQLTPPAHFTFCLQPDLPTFTTQRRRLQNVFMHIIDNAIRFNDKPQGKVNVSFEEQENYYQFSVEDNGPGIESQYYDKVFAIFQTLEARDKVESTGIGLTIAKKIVEEHNGKIGISSVMGQGTTLYFSWPKEG